LIKEAKGIGGECRKGKSTPKELGLPQSWTGNRPIGKAMGTVRQTESLTEGRGGTGENG